MRQSPIFVKLVLCVCLVAAAVVVLSGCETCRGVKRDIQKADEWIKDNLW